MIMIESFQEFLLIQVFSEIFKTERGLDFESVATGKFMKNRFRETSFRPAVKLLLEKQLHLLSCVSAGKRARTGQP